MGETYKEQLRRDTRIHFIEDFQILRHIMLADVCIGDTNSLLAEFCMLDKPIITFRVQSTPRTMPDITALIENISERIDTFDEVGPAVERVLAGPEQLAGKRREAVRTTLGQPDGKAGLRAAKYMVGIVPELKKQAQ